MESGGQLSNLGAICLHAAAPLQRPADSCYFPWQACCLKCNRWFTSLCWSGKHSKSGESKSTVWTSTLITNYGLDIKGWFFPGGWVPSGLKSDLKEEPRPLPPLINLSRRRCWTQSISSNSPDFQFSEEFPLQVRCWPSLPFSIHFYNDVFRLCIMKTMLR